ESRKAVSRREGHERRWQALADGAHLLGIARVDEQHVGARFVKRFSTTQSLVEVVDPSCVCPSDDHEIGIGACSDRLGDFLQHKFGWNQMIDASVVLDTPWQ